MSNKIKDLTYVKKQQNDFLEHLKSIEGINYQVEDFNVPYWLILALQSELSEVLNESLTHKFWTNKKVDREKLVEELADFMAHMGNLANFLEIDMLLNTEEVQVTAIEVTFNRLAYQITTLHLSKKHSRRTFKIMLMLFGELVYSLGFSFSELEVAYKAKMEKNYEKFV